MRKINELWSIIGISFGLLVLLVNVTKTGLIPEEDNESACRVGFCGRFVEC